jgi:hypothetical protein
MDNEGQVLEKALGYLREIFSLRKESLDLLIEMVDMDAFRKKLEEEDNTLENWLEFKLRDLISKILEVEV